MDAEQLTHLVTIALSFGVGVPILHRALRARDRLAALLAASLVVDGLEWTFWALYLYWPGANPTVNDAFAIACRMTISAAVLCLGFFTWLTFRPKSRAAAAFLWGSVAAMTVGFFGSGAVGDWRGFRADHSWIWIEVVDQILVYGWACTESLIFWQRMRRRAAHGMADPILAQKFGLWAIYAGGYCVSQVLFAAALASPDGYTTLDPFSIVLTLAGVGALWLAFFPPESYRRWMRGEEPAT